MVCAALAYTLLSLCFISFAACLKQCINFCAKAEHAYDGTAIESVNKPAGFCVLLCQSMDGCEGFNYDSAAATCHLISSAHNLTAAAGLTAWSMKLCTQCLVDDMGIEYLGTKSTTVSGRTCMHWDQHKNPHRSYYKSPECFLPGDPRENYCRNPVNSNLVTRSHSTIWCYTTDPAKRWDECRVMRCDECDEP